MPRIALPLILLLATTSMARGQEARYVPIPFQGNFESLFKDRLAAAKKYAPFRELLNQIRENPKKYNLDPAWLKQIDLDSPALQRVLKNLVDQHPPGTPPTRIELEKLKKALDKIGAIRGTGQPPAAAAPDAVPSPVPNRPAAPAPPKPRTPVVERWIRDLAHEAENTQLADWLQDSPAFQKGLIDLKTLANFDRRSSLWDRAKLPDHLRLPDKLNLGMGESFFDKLSKLSLPDLPQVNVPNIDLPHVNLPHINLGNWNMPAVGLPRMGAPGGMRFGQGVLWLGVAVALVVLCWRLAKILGREKQLPSASAALGPWPLDPTQIATRNQLVLAFDYLAILVLGARVRSWNHRAIARQLAAANPDATVAAELASLYERARYATGPEALSIHEQSCARRLVAVLAGAAAS